MPFMLFKPLAWDMIAYDSVYHSPLRFVNPACPRVLPDFEVMMNACVNEAVKTA